MDRADILAGPAFRAVLRSVLAFVVVLAIGAFQAVRYVEDALMEEARQRVDELHHGLLDLDEIDNEVQLTALVETLATRAAGETLAYALYRPDRTLLAGNMDVFLPPETWTVRTLLDVEGKTGREEYLLHSSTVAGRIFVSGLNLSFVETAVLGMIRGFAIAGFLVVIAMVAIGYVMSRRSQTKFEEIEHVLERVASGEASARIGIVDAVDQIDRISQKIDAQLAKLEAVMQGTRRASAAVAHDLRKPLARVSLILERALARAEAGEDVRGEIEDGLAGLGKLNAIVSTVLRIARIEGHDIGNFQTFDLRALLDEVAETYEALAEDAGSTLIYARPPDAVEMTGDPDMIAQLVINLIQNAITHAGHGARITLDAARQGRVVTLTVSDTGPGIPEDQREHVFEPMYRGDAARTDDGTGLGLALVKAIADRHGADIRLEDARPGLRVVTSFPGSPP